MTNYDFIMSLDIECFEAFLSAMLQERDLWWKSKLVEAGVGFDFIALAPELQSKVNLDWLGSERDDNADM